jgi:hypothetical protein
MLQLRIPKGHIRSRRSWGAGADSERIIAATRINSILKKAALRPGATCQLHQPKPPWPEDSSRRRGEDLIQFVDADGNVVVWIDCNGVLYVNSSAVIHGATDGPTGVSVGPGQPGTPS